MFCIKSPAVLILEDGTTFRGTAFGKRHRHRRNMLQYRHDRVPGSIYRSELLRPDTDREQRAYR